jgi:hypothetical protein
MRNAVAENFATRDADVLRCQFMGRMLVDVFQIKRLIEGVPSGVRVFKPISLFELFSTLLVLASYIGSDRLQSGFFGRLASAIQLSTCVIKSGIEFCLDQGAAFSCLLVIFCVEAFFQFTFAAESFYQVKWNASAIVPDVSASDETLWF